MNATETRLSQIIYKGKYESKLEFPGGGGGGWEIQTKKPSAGEGGNGYFLEPHNTKDSSLHVACEALFGLLHYIHTCTCTMYTAVQCYILCPAVPEAVISANMRRYRDVASI